MIKRLYLKELVTFNEVELTFDSGLVVLTGPSGAGKSVLISAILSNFGYSTLGSSAICEITLNRPSTLKNDIYNLDDEFTIKTVKKEKLRYFLDGQNISKKNLKLMFEPYVKYLSVRDRGGFSSDGLLDMIDDGVLSRDKSFKKLLKEYKSRYIKYKHKFLELSKIRADEAKLIELIEYATYEVEKIRSINPQIGEERELLKVKQQLSRIDKIKDALDGALDIFGLEAKVEEVYRLLDKDSSIFSDAMNHLRADFEETESLADELAEVKIEDVLNRLSDIVALKNRYGGIAEALEYKELKERELLGYQNIEQDKSFLESFLELEIGELNILASKISIARKKESKKLENSLEEYLSALKLPSLNFEFDITDIDSRGVDKIDVMLGRSKTSTLSGGEFNRLRLALMAITIPKNKSKQGILILDEIDANVSGDESIAIAKLIYKLSSFYQVFAISHQPHLSAKAKQHILITKRGKKSRVEVLDEESRILEIARIISGEKPTLEALEFAKRVRS